MYLEGSRGEEDPKGTTSLMLSMRVLRANEKHNHTREYNIVSIKNTKKNLGTDNMVNRTKIHNEIHIEYLKVVMGNC